MTFKILIFFTPVSERSPQATVLMLLLCLPLFSLPSPHDIFIEGLYHEDYLLEMVIVNKRKKIVAFDYYKRYTQDRW